MMVQPAGCRSLAYYFVMFWAVFAVNCQDDPVDTPDDAGGDAATDAGGDTDTADADAGPFEIDDPYELVPFQEDVDRKDGHPDIEDGTPETGEVRVGRIQGDDTGFTGMWAHCRPGDFLFENSEIEVCIQSESTNRIESYTGGKLVDARRQGQTGDDVLDIVMPLVVGLATTSADEVEVVRDGSDGVAVLRVTGQDMDIAQITGVTGNRWYEPKGMTVETEYRLEPDTAAVEMVSKVTPDSSSTVSYLLGDWFGYGDRARAWTPDSGFGVASEEMPWVGGVGDRGRHSFGLVFEETASPMGIVSQFDLAWGEMRIDQLDMSADEPGVIRRWFAVGDGSLDSVREIASELREEESPPSPKTFTVVDDGGDTVADAAVGLFEDGTGVTFGRTDEQGQVDLAVKPGEYSAKIWNFAGFLEPKTDVTVGEEDVELTVPDLADVTFEVRDADTDEPFSARVTVAHSEHGSWYEYAIGGTLQTTVPAGDVTFTTSRGMEYDFHQQTMQLAEGDEIDEVVELPRTVDTGGWRSGDFHQHLEPSPDSILHVDDRVRESVTQGVELAVSTDHDNVSDLNPAIERLGVEEEISSFSGVEISPLYAHFGFYPIPYSPQERGRGTLELSSLAEDGTLELTRMPELVEQARSMESDPIVQMNHPRNSSGLMAHVGFDPEQSPDAVDHDDFVPDIDTIEVINRYDDVCQVAADWSGLLNAGYSVTGLGNSDSHNADGEAGVPRNFMVLDIPPSDLGPDPVREALRSGRVTVGSHAFIDFGDDTLPGDELSVDADGIIELPVRVQTPPWASTDTLFAIVNGTVVQTIDRTAPDDAQFDFDTTVEIEIDEPSWVVFWADGNRPSAPVPKTKRVIAFTNPVFLTLEGGQWEAPGPRPLDLEPLDTGYCD